MDMNKRLFLLTLIASCAALIGCQTIKQPKGSSKGYSSYQIYREIPQESIAFADSEDQIHAIIQNAIANEFKADGLKSGGADAELIVAYLVLIQNNTVSTAIHDYYINSSSEILHYAHKKVTVDSNHPREFKAGTLIVDVIDAKTNKLIYRDYSTKQIAEKLEGAAREARIKSAVNEALARFFK